MYCNKLQIAPMGAPELQVVLAVGGGAGVFSPSTRSKSASFVFYTSSFIQLCKLLRGFPWSDKETYVFCINSYSYMKDMFDPAKSEQYRASNPECLLKSTLLNRSANNQSPLLKVRENLRRFKKMKWHDTWMDVALPLIKKRDA